VTRSRPLLILASWLAVACIAAAGVMVRAWVLGEPRVGWAIVNELAIIPIWALATPLVFRATARWKVTWKSAPGYLAAGAAFVLLSNALIRLPQLFTGGFVKNLTFGLTTYGAGAMLAWTALVAIGVWLAPRAHSSRQQAPSTHLVLADGAKTLRFPLDDIDWIEAEDNYALIHVNGKTHSVRQRMSDLESRLDAGRFARVHRGAIVNLARVTAVRPLAHGDFEVVLDGGAVVRGARGRRGALATLSAEEG
jgi:hypothetical protein